MLDMSGNDFKGLIKGEKAISVIVTLSVVSILFFIGPAAAITTGVSSFSDETPNEGDTVNFLSLVDLHTDDLVPIKGVLITISRSGNRYECTFHPDGSRVATQCHDSFGDITLEQPYIDYQSPGFGYGYGYGFNDYTRSIKDGAEFVYNVTWTAPSVSSDMVRGLKQLMNSSYQQPINLSSTREITIKQLAKIILDLTDSAAL